MVQSPWSGGAGSPETALGFVRRSLRRRALWGLGLVLILLACGKKQEGEPPKVETPTEDLLWVRHILIRKAGAPGADATSRSRASADSLAQSLLQRIRDGEDFGALAKEYSEDPSSVDGGLIEPLQPGDAPPEFMAAASALQPGHLSEVVESAMGFHIIERRDMSTCTAQHILVRYQGAVSCPDSITRTREEALERAERILSEVRHPDASFPVAARLYSEDGQTSPIGGYLGTFMHGKMDPNFERAAFALKEGQISEIVESPYGFHIIRRVSSETIRVAHILVTYAGLDQVVESSRSREEALKRALDADFRAKNGEDFASLVVEYTDDERSAKRAGALPPLRRGQAVPEFEEAAFRLRPGEVSDVVETEFGFHVIKRMQ